MIQKLTQRSYTTREYKDRLFKFVFKDREKLLSLYNALNGSHYTNPEEIEITTLEDVIYCNMKNDVSFIIDDRLSLFEHQSSYNPNMPLRGFLYFAKHFEKYIVEHNANIYGRKLILLPPPKFVVFYNGDEMQEDKRTLRLSDAFMNEKEKACMELETEIININYGKNKELMEACRPLMKYAIFVDRVKKYSLQYERDVAIDLAVEECIREDVLKDILTKNRAEVVDMLLTEYDEEKRIRLERQYYEEMLEEAQRENKKIQKENKQKDEKLEEAQMEIEKAKAEKEELLKIIEELRKK